MRYKKFINKSKKAINTHKRHLESTYQKKMPIEEGLSRKMVIPKGEI